MSRAGWAKVVWVVTAVWLVVLVSSLKFGWVDGFFFDSSVAHVQGIDFFPVPRAFLNFVAGRSQFDTFAIAFGPRATWYLYHPALALVVGPILWAFEPWTAYGVWTALAMAMMGASAWLVMRRSDDPLRRSLVALLIVGGFPVYIMLYVGNVQALLVLSVTLVLVAVEAMGQAQTPQEERLNRWLLMTGLLVSLFSKPAVLAMMPLLLMLQPTRRTTLKALGLYAVVSLALVAIPGFNPVAMDWGERIHLLTHPALVAQTMNIYVLGMNVTQPMKDNSVHWLAMLGLADYRMLHIDVYSLTAFFDGLLHRHTPDAIYRVPGILVLEMSGLVWFVRSRQQRMQAALVVMMAASLLVFLSYGLVWEYHYTGVLTVAALLLIRDRLTRLEWAIVALGVVVWLPSPYFLLRHEDASQLWVQTVLRVDRVVPVLAIFCLLLVRAGGLVLDGGLQRRPAFVD